MNKHFTIILLLAFMFSCKTPEARKPETVKTGSFIKKSAERNKKLYQKEQTEIENYINSQDTKQFTTSEYGFWYSKDSVRSDSQLKTPKFGDLINFNFNLSALNGTVIYSSEELKTRNYAMDKEELFTGLREGLKLMKAGETFTFIFPSQKAYGYYGDENKIGRNTPLISQVTINSITQK